MARALVVILVLVAGAARGDESLERAKLAYAEAQRAYALGRFEEASAAYQRAYEASPRPALLFNIGQCERNLGHRERAIFFYEGYLSGDPSTRNRAAVEALISKLREEDLREPPPRPVVEEPRDAGAPPDLATLAPAPDLARPAPVPLALPSPRAPLAAKTPVYRRWWLWTTVALVGAVVIGAAVGIAESTGGTKLGALVTPLGNPIDAR